MNGIKNMLLGIAIILAVILFHICSDYFLWTDLIGIIGIILVVTGYIAKNINNESNEKL